MKHNIKIQLFIIIFSFIVMFFLNDNHLFFVSMCVRGGINDHILQVLNTPKNILIFSCSIYYSKLLFYYKESKI